MQRQIGELIVQTEEAFPPSPDAMCLYDLLRGHAERNPKAAAILGPEGLTITYGQLIRQINSAIAMFRAAGIGRNDRVAIVLPNGPEVAVACLATACCATSAPRNPAYRASEFDFYLSDLRARALLVQAGIESPARESARRLGVPIIDLPSLRNMPADAGQLTDAESGPLAADDLPGQEDIALVLHTSGTTARPKLVPLTHTNICAAAKNMAAALQLGPSDRCLNVMPLFHAHALVCALLASLNAGGSVACTPGFYAPQFFQWLEEYGPTWYTSAPTIHQAVLARVEQNRRIIERCH